MSTIWRPGASGELRNSGEAAEIWLADDGHLEQVQHELQQFLVDPLNRRYQAASWQTGHTDAGLHYQSESYLHTLRSKAGPLTLGVMVLCIAVYILMQALGDDTVMYWLSPAAGQQPIHAAVALGQPCVPAFLPAAYPV